MLNLIPSKYVILLTSDALSLQESPTVERGTPTWVSPVENRNDLPRWHSSYGVSRCASAQPARGASAGIPDAFCTTWLTAHESHAQETFI